MKRILLFGGNGQLGSALAPLLAQRGELTAVNRAEVDLLHAASVRNVIHELKPNIVVNAAGYTAVDRAETERKQAEAVNGYAPGTMAEEARRLGALLVHYSTDYVFDGRAARPYTEHDTPNPINHYGYTKWLGERNVEEHGNRYLILRTAWLYSREGHNFFRKILRLAREGDELSVVQDQIGTPTPARFIANETVRMIDVAEKEGVRGLFHVTAGGQTSWYGFAAAIMRLAATHGLATKPVVPILSDEYPSAARRPGYSVLDCSLAAATFGLTQIDWREGVFETMIEYIRAQRGEPAPVPRA